MAKRRDGVAVDKRLRTEHVEMHRITERYGLFRLVVKWGGVIGLAYVGLAMPFRYGAGKDTTLRYALEVVSNFHLGIILEGAAVGTFLYLWLRERQTSRKSIDREHRRVEELEKHVDPNRTSSGFKKLKGGEE